MRFLVLATDYDRTLAEDGRVPDKVWSAIRRFRESGRRAILVTGRELEDLQAICPHLELFDRVVAENGALIYDPQTKETRELAEPPPPRFAEQLRNLGVVPLSVGHIIVSTEKPFETAVLNVINELGLEMQVIFNKESVMVLPSGVNKATGLAAALKELGFSTHNVAAIGDAENDHALLTACECGVAVANGVPALRERADYVTNGMAGDGVIELIDHLLSDDLQEIAQRIDRHNIKLGKRADGPEERIPPFGKNVLIAGTSGCGKSTVCAGILEHLADVGYQFAIIDPEGDYTELPGAAVLGSPERAPALDEALNLVSQGDNTVINLVGIPLADRPDFADRLFPRLLESRGRTGRPHWIVIDETHHLMPSAWSPAPDRMPSRLQNLVMVTVHPGSVSPAMLSTVDLVLALGQDPDQTIAEFCDSRKITNPPHVPTGLQPGEVVAFWVDGSRPPFKLITSPPRTEQRRHRRKYAEGRLPDERNFVFSGPKDKLHLRAYNLVSFLELAAGVDDGTWLHHLKKGEYSQWFRDAIKDDDLARDVMAIEEKLARDAIASREAIRKAIEDRYTLPAKTPSGMS